MKILYSTRLFSSLEGSFSSRKWTPSGVPTIYKVIEEIDKYHTPRFLFMAKDSGRGYYSKWGKSNNYKIKISGLRHKVNIISGVDFFPIWLGRRLRIVLREIRQSLFFLVEVIKFKPDIVYCDHANILTGGILSRVQKKTLVVFRVMGVDGFMKQCLAPKGFIQKMYRWAYKSPFDLVLCTQDGSGVELWTDTALAKSVIRKILLNGIDVKPPSPSIVDKKLLNVPDDKVVILFVGKLEKYKGCYEFIQAMLLLKDKCSNIHVLIVGIGNEKKSLKKLIKDKLLIDDFTFIDSLPHEQIYEAHSISDIYVSMNYFGNLSNANLEAIQSNDCMVFSDLNVNSITNSVFKKSIAYAPIKDPKGLSNVLVKLVNSKEKRIKMSRSVNQTKRDFLWSWKDRINAEITLLEEVLNKKKIER